MKKRDGWGVALALGSLCLLAVVSLYFRPAARTSAPATAEECRAAAEALGLPYVEESALTPLLPEGLSLERRQLRMDAPRAGRAGSQRFRAAMETTQRRRCPRPLERSAPWRPAARRTDSAARRGPACSTRCGRKAGSSR